MAKLIVMDRTGDTPTEWDVKNPTSVQAAMDRFNDLVKNHKHWAYKVNKDGTKQSIKKFDKEAEEILVHAQMIGG